MSPSFDRRPVAAPDDWLHTVESGETVLAARGEDEAFVKRLVAKYGRRWLEANDGSAPILVDERIRIPGPVVAFQGG